MAKQEAYLLYERLNPLRADVETVSLWILEAPEGRRLTVPYSKGCSNLQKSVVMLDLR